MAKSREGHLMGGKNDYILRRLFILDMMQVLEFQTYEELCGKSLKRSALRGLRHSTPVARATVAELARRLFTTSSCIADPVHRIDVVWPNPAKRFADLARKALLEDCSIPLLEDDGQTPRDLAYAIFLYGPEELRTLNVTWEHVCVGWKMLCVAEKEQWCVEKPWPPFRGKLPSLGRINILPKINSNTITDHLAVRLKQGLEMVEHCKIRTKGTALKEMRKRQREAYNRYIEAASYNEVMLADAEFRSAANASDGQRVAFEPTLQLVHRAIEKRMLQRAMKAERLGKESGNAQWFCEYKEFNRQHLFEFKDAVKQAKPDWNKVQDLARENVGRIANWLGCDSPGNLNPTRAS